MKLSPESVTIAVSPCYAAALQQAGHELELDIETGLYSLTLCLTRVAPAVVEHVFHVVRGVDPAKATHAALQQSLIQTFLSDSYRRLYEDEEQAFDSLREGSTGDTLPAAESEPGN